jgi:hypothetical protein
MTLHWRALWVALLVFTAACMASPLTISIRHFSTPLLLLIVLLAPLPRMIQAWERTAPRWARGMALVAGLSAVSSLVAVVRAYPNYFPFFNALTLGHPAYWWASDSNVDWNHALPEVRRFAEAHGLQSLALDPYGSNDPTVMVPQAHFWNCQSPTSEDSNHWVVVSSNMIMDNHNCLWLMGYPHEMLAGGSMWAVRLPASIPAAGSSGGPPPPSEHKQFLGMPEDMRLFTLELVRHPERLPQVCADAEKQIQTAWREGWARRAPARGETR